MQYKATSNITFSNHLSGVIMLAKNTHKKPHQIQGDIENMVSGGVQSSHQNTAHMPVYFQGQVKGSAQPNYLTTPASS